MYKRILMSFSLSGLNPPCPFQATHGGGSAGKNSSAAVAIQNTVSHQSQDWCLGCNKNVRVRYIQTLLHRRATPHHGTRASPHGTPVEKKGQSPGRELQLQYSHCPSPSWRSGLTAQAPQPSCCIGTGAGGEGKGKKLFQVTWTRLHQIGLPDTIQLAEVGHRAENSFVLLPS